MLFNYKILQLRLSNDPHPYLFLSWKWARNHGFKLQDYDEYYEDVIEVDDSIVQLLVTAEELRKYVCEKLFYKFNVERPPLNFRGHSLSVSDIISVDNVLYYCDTADFVKIAYKEEE